MKKLNGVLWGVVLVMVGVILALNAGGVTDIDLFFDGWWTVFIIVPSAIGLITSRDKWGSIIGLLVGVFLLLACQDVLDFSLTWKILLPAVVVLIGLRLIIKSLFPSVAFRKFKNIQGASSDVSGPGFKEQNALFSGANMILSGEVFEGAELNALFGGIQCDLRGAIIQKDCAIEANAMFGGIDIFVPNNINISVDSNSIFGGVENKTNNGQIEGAPTLYIKASGIFGGVDIK